MEEDDEALILIWKQGKHKRTLPFHLLTNTPSFRTTPASCTYHAFMALCEAAKAQYYHREHVLQMPGQLQLDEEFMMEENVHAVIQRKTPSSSKGATSNNVTVQVSNLLSERESKTEMRTTKMGPLTFDVNPQLAEDEHGHLSTADHQAKLMHWHYRPPSHLQGQAACAQWQDPSRSSQGSTSHLHIMPLWCHD
jgi:hypothetical protein